MYKALMRDADYAANLTLANAYYTSFYKALMAKEMREKADDPNANIPKGTQY